MLTVPVLINQGGDVLLLLQVFVVFLLALAQLLSFHFSFYISIKFQIQIHSFCIHFNEKSVQKLSGFTIAHFYQ